MVAYGSLDACAHVSPAPLPAPGRWSATNPPPQHGSGASTSVVEPCVVFATYSLTLDPLRAVEETKDQAQVPPGGHRGRRGESERSAIIVPKFLVTPLNPTSPPQNFPVSGLAVRFDG